MDTEKRQFISIRDKLKCIDRIKKSENAKKVADGYSVSVESVHKWKSQEKDFRDFTEENFSKKKENYEKRYAWKY